MDVYIKAEEETFHFPVNPFSVSINGGKKYDTFDILHKGDTDFPAEKAKRIRVMTLDTMFPSEYEPYCRYRNIPTPEQALKKIIGWSESSTMVRLIITEFSFNEMVNIADYQVDGTGENQGDIYITLNIRVAREDATELIKIERRKSPSPAPKLKENRAQPKQEKLYVVKSGDSLFKIAKKVLGNGSRYQEIYGANKGVIGNNPNLIYPGQKFIIPG